MGHHITALIGSREALSGLAARFGPPDPTKLDFGLAILPLDERRLDAIATSGGVLDGFNYLTPAIAAGIAASIHGDRALYIETNYFGGTGGQGAALFAEGELRWTDTQAEVPPTARKAWYARLFAAPPGRRGKSPISAGLARLGVIPDRGEDEFDRLGLVRFRTLECLGID